MGPGACAPFGGIYVLIFNVKIFMLRFELLKMYT